MSKLRYAALNIFIHMLQPKDLEPLQKEFLKYDKDKTGFLNANELKQAM